MAVIASKESSRSLSNSSDRSVNVDIDALYALCGKKGKNQLEVSLLKMSCFIDKKVRLPIGREAKFIAKCNNLSVEDLYGFKISYLGEYTKISFYLERNLRKQFISIQQFMFSVDDYLFPLYDVLRADFTLCAGVTCMVGDQIAFTLDYLKKAGYEDKIYLRDEEIAILVSRGLSLFGGLKREEMMIRGQKMARFVLSLPQNGGL